MTQSIQPSFVETSKDVKDSFNELVASGVREYFRGYSAINAWFAFINSPLKEEFSKDRLVDLPAACERHGLNLFHVQGLVKFLEAEGFVKLMGEKFILTQKGRAGISSSAVGFVNLIRGGYGNLMHDALKLSDNSVKYRRDISRDGHFVALGSTQVTSVMIDEVPIRYLKDSRFKALADLGCGGGLFMIKALKSIPDLKVIGIDYSEEAIELARKNLTAAGLISRAELIVADCFKLELIAERCRGVDLFYSFALEHEVLYAGEKALLDHLDGMAKIFPGKRYLIGEPMPIDASFLWMHNLSCQGTPRDAAGWSELLSQLKHAKLESIFVPDHLSIGAFYDVKFL